MPKQEIVQSLEDLRTSVQNLSGDESQIKSQADQLIKNLESHIGQEEQTSVDEGLLEQVGNFIEEYEVDHPKMTSVLNRIMNALASLGI